MYNIDTMYDAMADGLLSAWAEHKAGRWMAMAAFWLARQQIYGQRDYWLALGAKVTNELSAGEKDAIMQQPSRTEADAVDNAPADWPAVPEAITAKIASWSPTPVPADLPAYAAATRYAVETGGIVVNGAGIPTDRQSQAMITGAYSYAEANPAVLVQFKTSGGFVELNVAQVTATANAVGAHVQASFAEETTVVAAITAGTITTTAEIDAAAWPVNGAA